ncbi:MAG: ATP-binding cassette domain-containing protein [Bdellovibrionales bacterium]|jgi:ABC-type multidrug transport system ATPase subunit|nr:ATP-binding cassette domain-containing protein [Bdellovibrionales bacterium]MBT3525414.1 ATP-binding cassette domain-containing protein [Bdellovibrionales bacterium]MBT7766263.1 ATP-binding cassette domain-containing protein [Bdellovibrionales bacterium]
MFDTILKSKKSKTVHGSGLLGSGAAISPGTIYKLEDVSVKFGRIEALSSLQLTVQQGEILFVTGASGSGKTTLLNLLAEKQAPTEGRIYLPANCGVTPSPHIARVFQDLRLMHEESCEDNLWTAYDSSLYSNRAEFLRDLTELARVLGVTDRLKLKIKSANGGLKQKVAIMRALLTRPDIFLADEPTSSLDSDNAVKLFELLNLYNVKRGMTVIWASHNRELVKRFSGRIVHLDQGRLIYSGHACFI